MSHLHQNVKTVAGKEKQNITLVITDAAHVYVQADGYVQNGVTYGSVGVHFFRQEDGSFKPRDLYRESYISRSDHKEPSHAARKNIVAALQEALTTWLATPESADVLNAAQHESLDQNIKRNNSKVRELEAEIAKLKEDTANQIAAKIALKPLESDNLRSPTAKYDVHVYATVRLKVEGIVAANIVEAAVVAERSIIGGDNLHHGLRTAQVGGAAEVDFADEITSFVVDLLDSDGNVVGDGYDLNPASVKA